MQFQYVSILKISIHFVKMHFSYSEKTKRDDSGKYELLLRNAKGEVKVSIDVTVIGKIIILFVFKMKFCF